MFTLGKPAAAAGGSLLTDWERDGWRGFLPVVCVCVSEGRERKGEEERKREKTKWNNLEIIYGSRDRTKNKALRR